jgi:hypothetical protein
MDIWAQIQSNVPNVLLTDFAKDVTYTPAGGSPKTIKALITASQTSEFATTEDLDYDVTEVVISCLDNSSGHIAPEETGRGTAGDKITMPTTGVDYWVKRVAEDGRDTGSGTHRLIIASTPGSIE